MRPHQSAAALLVVLFASAACEEPPVPEETAPSATLHTASSATPTREPKEETGSPPPESDCDRVRACCDAAAAGVKKGCVQMLDKGECAQYIDFVRKIKGLKPGEYDDLPGACKF